MVTGNMESYVAVKSLWKGAALIKQKIYCGLSFLFQIYAAAKVINSKIRLRE